MKLSCLFAIVMCFGFAAIMALPLDNGSFGANDEDHYHEVITIHEVPKKSPTNGTPNTRKADGEKLRPHKYFLNGTFRYDPAVKQVVDTPTALFKNITNSIDVSDEGIPYTIKKQLESFVGDSLDVTFANTSITNDGPEENPPNAVEDTSDAISENASIIVNALEVPQEYHVEDTPKTGFENTLINTNVSETNLSYDSDVAQINHSENSPDILYYDIYIGTNESEKDIPYAKDIPPEYYVKDTTDAALENISIATNVSERNLLYAVDVPLEYYVEDTPDASIEKISTTTKTSEVNLPYFVDVPLKHHEVDTPDFFSETSSITTNVSGRHPPYDFDILPDNHVNDTPDAVSENISISTKVSELPYVDVDIPQRYHLENTTDDWFEGITIAADAFERNFIDVQLDNLVEDTLDALFKNRSGNTNDSEPNPTNVVDIPLDYYDHLAESPELAESPGGKNVSTTTELLELDDITDTIAEIGNESLSDRTNVTGNCTNCTADFEITAETKLIGCMCALFTTRYPTEYDIPLTSRTFHNVSCQRDVDSEDACNKVCVGVATINNELKDRVVCSFVPDYITNVKAFLQSKLCEEGALWSFTGISSPVPICCYMGRQIPC